MSDLYKNTYRIHPHVRSGMSIMAVYISLQFVQIKESIFSER